MQCVTRIYGTATPGSNPWEQASTCRVHCMAAPQATAECRGLRVEVELRTGKDMVKYEQPVPRFLRRREGADARRAAAAQER